MVIIKRKNKKHEKMAVNAVTAITNCFESRTSHSQFHTREYELNNNNDPRNRRSYNNNYLWVCITKMVWENITHTSASSGGLVDTDSVYTLHTVGDPFTLEITTRAASQVLSVEVIDREIDVSSTTVSLSVFSQ